MATYYSNVWNTKTGGTSLAVGGNMLCGRLEIPAGTAVATGDILNLCRVRAGTNVLGFHGESNAWGSAVPGTLGTYGVDDDAAITADNIIADVDLEDADVFLSLATPLAAPFITPTEDYTIRAVVGTVSSGTSAGVKYLNFAVLLGTFGETSSPRYAFTYNGAASGTSATE